MIFEIVYVIYCFFFIFYLIFLCGNIGKFQMQVLPACGHAVHEDVPDKVAEAIATFMVRHKFAEPASDFPR